MARIFISYRHEDGSGIWVSRLVEELRRHFPSEQIFQDITSIDPGADFHEALEKALVTAGVMLAVIDPHWLSATDQRGRRRLDLPNDWVRQEIVESLRRPGMRVFPLLVDGAQMPSEEELPDPLQPLVRRQAFELTWRHWGNDVAELVKILKRIPGLSGERTEDEADARERAKQEERRRDAEARAAQEQAERMAAEEQTHRRVEDDAQRKAAEEEARRRAAHKEAERAAAEEEIRERAKQNAPQGDAEARAAQEQAERIAAEEAERQHREEQQRKATEEAEQEKQWDAASSGSGEAQTGASTLEELREAPSPAPPPPRILVVLGYVLLAFILSVIVAALWSFLASL